MILDILQASDWAIIAHGSSLSEKQLRVLTKDRKILALDGGANMLREYHIHPQAILGDFDSIKNTEYWGITGTFSEIDESTKPYKGNFGIIIVPAKDQECTDLEKGIRFCLNNGANSIIILNALGGSLDHTLGNIGLLRKYYQPHLPIYIYSEKERIEFIRDGSTTIKGKIGDRCAIMGFPEATLTTKGLAYNGTKYPLKLGIQESVCNSLASLQATVDIIGEALVIHPYHLD